MSLVGITRGTIKTVAAMTFRYSGLQKVLCRASRIASGGRRVLIVSYHRVVEDFHQEARVSIPGLLVSKPTFERHIDELTRGRFQIVSLDEALDVVQGCSSKKGDVAVITFDDGYQDVYEHAFPVLRRKGIPAIIYLTSGLVGTKERFLHDRLYHLLCLKLEAGLRTKRRNVLAYGSSRIQAAGVVDRVVSTRSASELKGIIGRLEHQLSGVEDIRPASGAVMTWSMAREMLKEGIQFGAHTVSHTVLACESDESIDYELKESKEMIEKQLGGSVVDFAYPNGCYDPRVFAFLKRHGFRSAVTTEDLPNQVGRDLFRLRRKTLWEDFSRGPFGYSSALTSCHLDGIFTLLDLSKSVSGERESVFMNSVVSAQG